MSDRRAGMRDPAAFLPAIVASLFLVQAAQVSCWAASDAQSNGGTQPAAASLLDDMGSNSRWVIGGASSCGLRDKTYTLQFGSNAMTWRRDGSIDVETINSSDEDQIRTTTRTSSHPSGNNVPTGQTWTYSRAGSRIRVQTKQTSFMLSRCP